MKVQNKNHTQTALTKLEKQHNPVSYATEEKLNLFIYSRWTLKKLKETAIEIRSKIY